MARRVIRLTDKEIENAKPKNGDYRLYDGDGLQLLVRSSGTKVWQYPYSFKDKKSIYTIGEYHKSKPGALGIKDARIKRHEVRALLDQGVDPNVWKKERIHGVEGQEHTTFEALARIKPDIVIHTSGPFQGQDYDVEEACIAQGCHYIDLADGRGFVEGITALSEQAKAKGVMVISGASSVPCLTAALVDHYRAEFKTLESLDYGITTAQKTNRGLATTAAILSYTGKPFPTLVDGKMKTVYGWQGLRARKYPVLGWRLLGNCDVPDLALFPKRYPELKTVRFYAGLEIPFIHLTLWGISWMVRIGLIRHLEKAAPLLLKISYLFDWLGTANSGFHMQLSGAGHDGQPKTISFELTARSGDGPYIPCMPAILMAKKLAAGNVKETGASPCVGFITKDEYLGALEGLDISWKEE